MDEVLKDISEFVSGCLGPLGGNGSWPTWIRDFLIQIIATLILFLIIRFFLWKPITKLLEERKKATDEALTKANEAKENALALENSLQEKYAASKKEIERLLAEAEATGNKRREEIIKEAEAEAIRRLKLNEEELELEVKKKEKDIKDEIIAIAFMAAEKIVDKEIDRSKYLDTVTKIIDSGLDNE